MQARNGIDRTRTGTGRWALLLVTVLFSLGADGAAPREAKSRPLETRVGLASYYARHLQGRETASGEPFDRREMVAAHPYYPLGTRVRVIARKNGRAVTVRINDRGPARENWKEGVIIDLSPAAAAKLGVIKEGRSRVKVQVLEWGEGREK